MSDESLQQIAIELVNFLCKFENSDFLRKKMGLRGVLTECSVCECGRTIELEILEADHDQLLVGAFIDPRTRHL